MFRSLLFGAAFLIWGAAPSWAGYVPVNVCLPYSSGYFANSALSSDGVDTSYGIAYLRYGSANRDVYCMIPSSASTSIVRITGYTNENMDFRVTLRYADGVDSGETFTAVANVVNTWYLSPTPAYIDKVFRTPDAIKIEAVSTKDYAYFYIGEVQIFSPSSSIDTIITPDVIESLLQNATFQTTISSIAAASDIADFITFKMNETGGKAAWLFGCFLALMFIFGIRVGVRS